MTPALQTDIELASRLRLVVTRLGRRLRHQAAGDLTPSQMSALASVVRLGPMTLGDLSTVENVRPPTVTKVVATLEEQGLVVREVDPSDRRVSRIDATVRGSELLAESRSRSNAYLAARLQALPPDERATLERAIGMLERLIDGEE